MAREELPTCPKCGVGKMRPTGLAATSGDEETNTVAVDFRGKKCDTCGYPNGGQKKIGVVNE
jgi:predicted nucleic-acid-binding Zn-ribbon protein